MEHELVARGYIPELDKSLMMRFGFLDIMNEYSDITTFLRSRWNRLGDDLKALYHASVYWRTGDPIYVGESATLYRFLRFASWKKNLNKEFILEDTLEEREICDDPEIVNYSLEKLLKLDKGTSQYASASVLMGNKETVKNPPYKLRLTYEALHHWKERRNEGKCWEPRHDETILRQAVTFLKMLKHEYPKFTPRHSEDYFFAVVFGYTDIHDAKRLFPSVEGHETNRHKEVKKVLSDYAAGREIVSKDHRAIQAIEMKAKLERKEIKIKYPKKVNKSWPEFWKFLDDSLYLQKTIV